MKTLMAILLLLLFAVTACNIYPRNTLSDCRAQCKDSKKSKACYEFCDCIHQQGHSLDSCLDAYNKATDDSVRVK